MMAGVIQQKSGAAAIDQLNETLYLSLDNMIDFGRQIHKIISYAGHK